ncbi:SRPBCC family protein [Flavihumibacter petaseus]|nr:SRPBCC family protein [Flavihumibacter petaseus]
MKILLTIIGILAILIILVLIIALYSKRDYTVQREIVINQPVDKVFDYVRHLKNQDYFNKWVMRDPDMKKSFRGTDGTVGFVYGWDGNKQAGAGEQEIMSIDPNKQIGIVIRFERPFKAIAQAPITVEAVTTNQTRIRWRMSSSMKYPMNAMMLFADMDRLLGKDLQWSLEKLKGILEK